MFDPKRKKEGKREKDQFDKILAELAKKIQTGNRDADAHERLFLIRAVAWSEAQSRDDLTHCPGLRCAPTYAARFSAPPSRSSAASSVVSRLAKQKRTTD